MKRFVRLGVLVLLCLCILATATAEVTLTPYATYPDVTHPESKSLLVYQEQDGYGLMDLEGNKLTDAVYASLDYDFVSGYLEAYAQETRSTGSALWTTAASC